MDITEAKTRKHALGGEILAQLREYERVTGATVEAVRIETVDLSTVGELRRRCWVAVRVDVRL